MRMLSYLFETALNFSEPVTDHSFVLRCLPKSTCSQKVLESQVFTHPRISLAEQTDGFGNRMVVGYCPEAHDAFDFRATGLVMVDTADVLPEPAHPLFLQSTPLTRPDDALMACVRSLSARQGSADDVWLLAQRANELVFQSFAYTPGATTTATTAAEAFSRKQGVCQDYAHVLIALCRALGIPARYITGLMVGEGATHAWVEVHDGARWRGLDPTHNAAVNDDYVQLASGRDFDDCPIERGVFRGNALQEQHVHAAASQRLCEES